MRRAETNERRRQRRTPFPTMWGCSIQRMLAWCVPPGPLMPWPNHISMTCGDCPQPPVRQSSGGPRDCSGHGAPAHPVNESGSRNLVDLRNVPLHHLDRGMRGPRYVDYESPDTDSLLLNAKSAVRTGLRHGKLSRPTKTDLAQGRRKQIFHRNTVFDGPRGERPARRPTEYESSLLSPPKDQGRARNSEVDVAHIDGAAEGANLVQLERRQLPPTVPGALADEEVQPAKYAQTERAA